ncbi:MAG: sugar phosphate isomerase/epimerase family protein [Casimicrobiaceae bacterium]
MKLGIDSYTYHRFFGEWYAGLQDDPGARMTVFDFLDRAKAHGVAGVSLESCFLPDDDASIDNLREGLDARGLERVWAWGHPSGLQSGKAPPDVAQDLVKHLGVARRVGARVMRICGGGRRTRPDRWDEHKRGLVAQLRPLVDEAQAHGVVMAIENHIDLLADEMVDLIETIGSPWLGVCYDTANNLRMLEDPVVVARKLAPYARATHVKDVTAQKGDPKTFAFWPSVPLGRGLIDLPEVLARLDDAKFDGLLALEIDYLAPAYVADGEEAAVGASLDYLRNAVAALPARH